MPFAVDLIRKLGEAGITIYAADTFETAAGSHSRYIKEAFVVPSPRNETRAFVDAVARRASEHHLDFILPAFEEGLYLAEHRRELPARARLLTPHIRELRRLHNKASFFELLGELKLLRPRGSVVTSQRELLEELSQHEHYLARPAYSRGGITVLTNRGPLAGALAPSACRPSQGRPWLVQEFVEGRELCTYSVAREGRLTAHVTYVHPQTIDHGGGVTFESVESDVALHAAATLARATRYTGHFGLDLRGTDGDAVVVECNPRATAGLSLLLSEELVEALFGSTMRATIVCPAGRHRKITYGLLLDMLSNWRHIPEDLRAMFTSGHDIYATVDDPLPALYQILAYSQVLDYHAKMPQEAKHDLRDVVQAQFFDVVWENESV